MQKQTFYQKDTKGKTRVWTIEVVKVDNKLSNIVTSTSIEDTPTSVIETITPIDYQKNVGKANETSVHEQAITEAETEIKTKIKKGYVTDITQIKQKNETATIKDPMKGYAYHPNPDPTNNKDKRLSLDKLEIRGVKVGISRKLDGWRYRIHVDENGCTFYTSSGDKTLEFPQITKSIHTSFLKIKDYVFSKYGITEYYLDGEMYAHEILPIKDDKNKIIDFYYEKNANGFAVTASACGSGKNKTTQDELSDIKRKLRNELKFHLFDVCLDAPFITRSKVLEYFFSDVVLPVDTIYLLANEAEIEVLMSQFLNEGYEGLMIRKLNMPYEYKRTKQLTKYKPMIDDEFPIVGFKKSITGDTLGSLECAMPNGDKFYVNLKDDLGDDTIKQLIWDNQTDYLGKWVTVDFMEYTPDGICRHGRAKAFRKGKSID